MGGLAGCGTDAGFFTEGDVGMTMDAAWFERACRRIPGGVNSPVRAFNGVGGTPLYVASGKGARLTAADGRELTDFCCSWGAMILGHAHPEVVAAVAEAAARGSTFGINTMAEVTFAERLCGLVPSMDRVRLVSSGTEAVMTAVRLARGVTGRRMIVKFDGCYHGHSDGLLVAAGSGLLTAGVTASKGVSEAVAAEVFVLPYNDLAAVEALVAARGAEIAAILVEPAAGNMGCVLPEPGFLGGLRAAADRCGALLVFDEVITGFRFHLGTYGRLCNVVPDLTTLGKVIGGGLPLAAIGGRAAVMDELSPLGGVYQAGTLSGNPVAVAAGLATLAVLERDNPYPMMAEQGWRLREGLAELAAARGLAFEAAGSDGVFTPFFCAGPIRDLAAAKRADTQAYARFFHAMLDAGFYLPPSQFEVAFVSAAHAAEDVDRFLEAAGTALTRAVG